MDAISEISWEPFEITIEQAILGGFLISNDTLSRVSDILREDHFFDPLHRLIFQCASQLISAGKPASPLSLRPFIADHMIPETGISVRQYLARLAANALPASMIRDHAMIVRDLAARRTLMDVAYDLTEAAPKDVMQLATTAIEQIDTVISEQSVAGTRSMSMGETMARSVDSIATAYQNEGKILGLCTGLYKLDRKLLGFNRGHLIILGGRPGMGKEQPIDTPILTPHGWSEIGKIRPGDFVVGSNGKPVRVNAVFPQGIKPAYRVFFRDYTSTECGLDHLWAVQKCDGRNRHETQVKPLRDLMLSGLCRTKKDNRRGAKWHIPLCHPVEWPDAELPIDPYCLGVFIGDGSVINRDIRFSNPDFDCDIRQEFQRRMPHVRLKEGRYGESCPYYEVEGRETRETFRRQFSALGLNVKSGLKFIPLQYLQASVSQRRDLLHALMDTDGHCSKNGGCSFSTTSPLLARDMCELVRSLGGWAISRVNDRSHHGKSNEYTVRIRIAECPFFTSRKSARWSCSKVPSKYIWSAEYSRDVEQVCISVDAADGLYLTNDYIVTHNSAVAASWSASFARAGHRGKFFSLEMTDVELGQRMLSDALFNNGPVPYSRLRSGNFDEAMFSRVVEAAKEIETLPLSIEPQAAQSLAQIAARARQAKARGGLDFIVVDHLQIVKPTSRYSNRVHQIGEITSGMKALAKEIDVAVILLCQLSRAVESREDKRPMMSDLRDSGDIEQDADVVIMVYRESYYLQKRAPPASSPEYSDWQTACLRAENRLELIVEKQRAGSTGPVEVFCNIASNAVRNLDEHEILPTADIRPINEDQILF